MKVEIILKYFYFTCNHGITLKLSVMVSAKLSRLLTSIPRVFLYLFISVSILHCTELRLSTLNKEYMMMMMMTFAMYRSHSASFEGIMMHSPFLC